MDFVMGRLLNTVMRVLEDAFLAPGLHLSVLKSNTWTSWLKTTIELRGAFGRSRNPGDEFQERLQSGKGRTEDG